MSDSCVTLWTVAHQTSVSMGFSRQEYWSGLPFPSPEHLPRPGFEPLSPALAGEFFTTEPPGKPQWNLEKVEFKAKRGEKGALWTLGSWHSARPRPQVLRVHWVRMVSSYSWVGQKLRCAKTILGWTLHFYTLSWSALNIVILFPPFFILTEKMEVQKT